MRRKYKKSNVIHPCDNIINETTHNVTTHNVTTSKEMTAYIIVNESLNMSKGKIASQSAHGILEVYRFLLCNKIDYSKWINYGEKIVVIKASSEQINEYLSLYNEKIGSTNSFNLFPIYDAGRTEVENGSLTVLASTPVTEDKKPEFIKKLKLL